MAFRISFSRALLVVGLLLAGVMSGAGSRASTASVRQPDKLVILSVTDVKGKTAPCGCHVPKGGLARQATFADSIKGEYGQVLWVDNGGFFPEEDTRREAAWFLMDEMKSLNLDAVNVGERDLRYGRAYLEQHARALGLPVVSANLLDRRSRRPVFDAHIIKHVGGVTVGIFGIISNKVALGPGADSLTIADPTTTARAEVAELKQRGAQVIVLLSQQGKAEGEDMVTAVDGIDAVILGGNIILLEHGRMVKNTIACYGGEQGQYMCRTDLTLGADHKTSSATAEAVMLGPTISDRMDIAAKVKAIEDMFSTRARRLEMEHTARQKVDAVNNSPHHYLGSDVCLRCHPKEGDQWLTTAHAQAWQSLVASQHDKDEKCIKCHVSGYLEAGGFASFAATRAMANIQCESCHGFGTDHDIETRSATAITAQTCTGCHDSTQDPGFDFHKAVALIGHGNSTGESVRTAQSKAGGRGGK